MVQAVDIAAAVAAVGGISPAALIPPAMIAAGTALLGWARHALREHRARYRPATSAASHLAAAPVRTRRRAALRH